MVLLLQILFQRKLFGESAVRFRNIGLGVTVALIPFDGGAVTGADKLSWRKLLKLVLDGTEFLPVAVLNSGGKAAKKENILFLLNHTTNEK